MPAATRQLVGISIFSEEKKSGHSGIRLRRISGIQKKPSLLDTGSRPGRVRYDIVCKSIK